MSDISKIKPASEVASPTAGESSPSFLSKLLGHSATPLVVAAVVVGAVALSMFPGKFSLPGTAPAIVVFDPVKFINAQRAAASFLAMTPNNELALAMTQVAKQTEAVIEEEADGALVLVKQAVIGSKKYPDITDRVIQRFGLDPNVPTVSGPEVLSIETVAPTDHAFSRGQAEEEYRMELQQRSARAAAEQAKKSAQEQVLP